jgi:hypothetical protein
VKRSLQGALLATAFIATQVLAGAGCNALLSNGYGVDDGTNGGLGPDGGPGEDDALVNGGEGGSGGEGGPGDDAMTTGEGSTLDANVDAACPMSKCPTMLAAATGPQRLVLDSTFVYWTTAAGVGRVGTNGNGATFLALGSSVVSAVRRGIALVPGGNAYVTIPDRGAVICASDLTSCASPGFLGTAGTSSSVAVDSTKVYVGIFDDGNAHGGIFHATLSGTAQMAYPSMTDQVRDIRVIGPTTYFMSTVGVFLNSPTMAPTSAANLSGAVPSAFDVRNGKLVVATKTNEIVVCTMSLPALSCPMATITVRPGKITAIAVDGTDVIWAELDPMTSVTSVYRSPLTIGATAVLLAGGQGKVLDLVADTKDVYWTSYGDAAGMGGAIIHLGK